MLTRHKHLRWIGFLALLFGILGALQIAVINYDMANRLILIPLWGMISTGSLAMMIGSQIVPYDGDAWDFVMIHEVSDRKYVKTKLHLIRWLIVIQALATFPFVLISLIVNPVNLLTYCAIFVFNLGVFAPLMLTYSIHQSKQNSLEKPASHSAYLLLFVYPVILLFSLVFGLVESMYVSGIILLIMGAAGLLMSYMTVNRMTVYFSDRKYKLSEIL